ncbi:hypothetical protein RHGRI_031422 [Rhododendron griersonianum]|uniref:Uncharacterized protein n=1 Tax=Rhododendron griersonianum TaxID=479676 RepID=A0AAV6IA94_9ERIC|nr:hypothetical protein RHGRI_031422 [Rhododendron griersonianum]
MPFQGYFGHFFEHFPRDVLARGIEARQPSKCCVGLATFGNVMPWPNVAGQGKAWHDMCRSPG